MRVRPLALALVAAVTVAVAPAPPAAAATPDRWGFAAVWNPTVPAGTTLDTTRQWGSWRAAFPALWATGGKLAVGLFRVTFPQVASGTRGTVHVTAVSRAGNYCEVFRWGSAGADEIVDVACHRPGGILADTPFTIMWSTSSGVFPPGAYATAQVNTAGAAVQWYNSTGAGAPGTGLLTPGRYLVRIPGVGVVGAGLSGNVQVTAIQPNAVARRCKVESWSPVGLEIDVVVVCVNAAGALTSTDFFITYHRQRAVFGAVDVPKYFGYIWSAGGGQTNYNHQLGFGANGVGMLAGGTYEVKYPQIGIRETNTHVTAYGDGPNYCGLGQPWVNAGSDALVNVMCFDNTGNPANYRFLSTFTSRH
ncbi:hypothetical protein SAMN05421812_103482 [Asanoa hainanensis]|uniref:Uncharacterized protein n=1 Tax=Asanoa hainanensis TaxID=560556 RepID=A0A239KDR3_9ACTN|nr:hypothetical protein [Asanoa hainanensis]SNT16506.1 hypothetical protein SAMN05421812_103482 [Asanoa hainanensis]